MPHVLALDQGTTSSRAILFDDQGNLQAVEQQEYKQHYPRPGWVEHDANEIWATQSAVAEQVLKKAQLAPGDVAALGITNQRETVVLWDRSTGKPLHNAIVWQDRRTSERCDQLRADGIEDAIREKTGLVIDPYFSATKIAWLLDNVAGARQAAEEGKLAAGTVDSWLIYRLTDGALHITDASNASRTQLMDIRSGDWDEQLLEWFRIPKAILPEIRPSSEIYGEVSRKLPLAGIRIAGIAGDQQSALFGQSCFTQGMAKNTYGTGCFMLTNTADEVPLSAHKLLTTVAWRLGDTTEYALEGSVFIGGAVVGWLRDGLGIIKKSSDIEALAGSVDNGGGIVFVPAFSGLGAPHWDPYARGTIVGVTQGTTAAHLAYAALESIALQVADLAEAMHSDSGVALPELRVDGGASVNDGLMQMQADLLQTHVVRPRVTETTALGAAYLAGLAADVWPDRDSIAQQWQVEKRFEPRISADQAGQRRTEWKRAVERAAGWARES